ncbi:DNA dC-_dU-editing enzyme APOBEC-3A-like [Pteropus vampyrus]|uniref:DNA dC->dU-editing enzyme APOBEC-3A-like n=1 Tax=Pteropus vampyrus TaxID=132908 RepID=A0A6P6C4C7_PTEVA|nr:DNA dC->dU-editing enzyme APOBEC-3A-like [Pteropus vampyrus]
MAAGPAPEARPLMDERTFLDNFSHLNYLNETYLCYEVDCMQDDLWIPLDEYKGFLRNKVTDQSRQDTLILGCSGRRFSVHTGCPQTRRYWSPQVLWLCLESGGDSFCCDGWL